MHRMAKSKVRNGGKKTNLSLTSLKWSHLSSWSLIPLKFGRLLACIISQRAAAKGTAKCEAGKAVFWLTARWNLTDWLMFLNDLKPDTHWIAAVRLVQVPVHCGRTYTYLCFPERSKPLTAWNKGPFVALVVAEKVLGLSKQAMKFLTERNGPCQTCWSHQGKLKPHFFRGHLPTLQHHRDQNAALFP